MKVYVVLVNFNSWQDTIECVDSLLGVQDQKPTIIIVDNASLDDPHPKFQDWVRGDLNQELSVNSTSKPLLSSSSCSKSLNYAVYDRDTAEKGGNLAIEACLVLVRNEVNLGFAGGCNVGIRYALARNDADFVWLLNNDTVIDPRALGALVKRMDERLDCGMCGSTLLFYDQPHRVQAYGGGRYLTLLGLSWHIGFMRRFTVPPAPSRGERYMNYVVGASLFVRRQFLEQVGLLNEDYFLFFEELDWAFRSRHQYKLAYAPESIVYHKVGCSIGTSSNPLKKSDLCDYFNLRNRIKFTKKYAKWALPGVYTVLVLAAVLRLCLGKWKQAIMVLRLLSGNPKSRWD